MNPRNTNLNPELTKNQKNLQKNKEKEYPAGKNQCQGQIKL